VKLLDALDVAPGWKSALLGLAAALSPFIQEVVTYATGEPLPAELVRTGHMVLVALIGVAMAFKVRRGS
jgi:hypothetical protein